MEICAGTSRAKSDLVSLRMWEGETSSACSRLASRLDGGRSMSGSPCDSRPVSLASMKLKKSGVRSGLLVALGIRFPARTHLRTRESEKDSRFRTMLERV